MAALFGWSPSLPGEIGHHDGDDCEKPEQCEKRLEHSRTLRGPAETAIAPMGEKGGRSAELIWIRTSALHQKGPGNGKRQCRGKLTCPDGGERERTTALRSKDVGFRPIVTRGQIVCGPAATGAKEMWNLHPVGIPVPDGPAHRDIARPCPSNCLANLKIAQREDNEARL